MDLPLCGIPSPRWRTIGEEEVASIFGVMLSLVASWRDRKYASIFFGHNFVVIKKSLLPEKGVCFSKWTKFTRYFMSGYISYNLKLYCMVVSFYHAADSGIEYLLSAF